MQKLMEHVQASAGETANCFFRQSNGSDKMLALYQTKQQQRILLLYGQTVVGMDATYKTTKWGFPMFIISVRTNHGRAHPVAMFVVEQETGEMITEALKM